MYEKTIFDMIWPPLGLGFVICSLGTMFIIIYYVIKKNLQFKNAMAAESDMEGASQADMNIEVSRRLSKKLS